MTQDVTVLLPLPSEPNSEQTGRPVVRTADIQHQLAVNVDPHVIVAGEEELDGDCLPILPHSHLAVFL